nr:glycoprotein hormone beta-5-like [Lytechinus pictus]
MVSTIQTLTTATMLVVMTSHLATANFDPATAIDCYVHTGMKHVAEKTGCDSSVINVRGCWGRCDSYQVPSLLTKLFDVSHPVCTPVSYKNITITLDNCAPGIDPTFSFVEATTCGCRKVRGGAVHYGYRPDYFLP